jgi:lipid-binding SYLF domain-containing protein
VGFQAGVQKSSHALFFMTDAAVENFRRADGWEIGADAEVTFPDAGLNAQTNTTIAEKPVIGIVFGQDGLLLGASLEGAKYSPIAR